MILKLVTMRKIKSPAGNWVAIEIEKSYWGIKRTEEAIEIKGHYDKQSNSVTLTFPIGATFSPELLVDFAHLATILQYF